MKFKHKHRLNIHIIEVHQNKNQENTDVSVQITSEPVAHNLQSETILPNIELKPDAFDTQSATEQIKTFENDHSNQIANELETSIHGNQNLQETILEQEVLSMDEVVIEGSAPNCKCNICGKPFDSTSNLEIHVNELHLFKRKFKAFCQFCKKQYVVENDKDKHFLYCAKLKQLPVSIIQNLN